MVGYSADSQLYIDVYQNFEETPFEYRGWDARTGNLINLLIYFLTVTSFLLIMNWLYL